MHATVSAAYVPLHDKPIAFAMNDFYDNAGIYLGTNNSGTATYSTLTNWSHTTYQGDMNDQFEWNARMNADTVSKVQYLPISRTVYFNITYTMLTNKLPLKLRFTLFTTKKQPTGSGNVDYSMPHTLGAYRNMAVDVGNPARNYFSPRYHNVLHDQWVTLDSDPATPKRGVKTVKIPFVFKPKEIVPDFIDPVKPIWQFIDPDEVIWCLISSSAGVSTDDDTNYVQSITMSSFQTWRDKHGVEG